MNYILQYVLIGVLAFMASFVFVGTMIPIMTRKQFGQYIREEGPQSHLAKTGTPTMGGIGIMAAIILVTVFVAFYSKALTLDSVVILLMMLLYGAMGFFDDYIKVAKKHNLGLKAWQKLLFQIVFGLLLALYMIYFQLDGTLVYIPFWGQYMDFSWLYIPFVIFVMVAMSNGVNLTDGLDGLSSGVTFSVAVSLGAITALAGSSDASVISIALAGACIGYLIHNKYPAKIFMGDTGSMAIGGVLAAIAIISRVELLLPVAGFIYVIESASVILQVGSFKLRGKRIFKMAPLHHHYEVGGMPEQQVVKMFWVISAAASVVAYLIYTL